jgi:tetratricopeptide (TPR) repeat protein/peroxiredoxin
MGLVADLRAVPHCPERRRSEKPLEKRGKQWLAVAAAAIIMAVAVGLLVAGRNWSGKTIDLPDAPIASSDPSLPVPSIKPAAPLETPTPPAPSPAPKTIAAPIPPPKLRPATSEVRTEPPEAKLPPSLSLEVGSITLRAGQVQRFPVRVTRRNAQGPVEVRFEGLPPGVRIPLATIEAGAAEVVVEIVVPEEVEKSERAARAVATLGPTTTSVEVQVRTEPLNAKTYLSRGEALLGEGEFARAVEQFDRAIERDGVLAAAYVKRARARCELQRFSDAAADCSKAIELGSKEAETYVVRAWAYNALGQYDKAIADCTEILQQLDAKNTEASHHRAFAYNQQGKYDLAIADCTAVIDRLGPSAAQAHANRAFAYLQTAQPIQALADLSAARRLSPKDAFVCLGLGLTHAALGEFSESIKAFTQAIELEPKCAEAYRYRGLAYAADEKVEEAERDFKQAIQLKPGYSCAHVDWGVTCSNASHDKQDKKQWTDKLDEAIARFDEAIAAAAKRRRGPVRRGREFVNFSCMDADCKCPTVAYVQRGLARMKAEDHEQAARDFSKAIEIDANCADAYYCREWANAFARKADLDLVDGPDLRIAAKLAPVMFGRDGKLDAGVKAPSWSNLLGTDDALHGLDDYKASRIVVLIFFGPTCQVCEAYAERLIKLDDDFRAKGVQIVAIHAGSGDRFAQMRTCAKKFKLPFPFLEDPTRGIATRYGALFTPTAFVLDRDRNVAYMGALDDAPLAPGDVKGQPLSRRDGFCFCSG